MPLAKPGIKTGNKEQEENKDLADRIIDATEQGSHNNSGKLKRYNLYLPVNHMEQLDILGKERGLKMSDMLRQAVREFLERN